MVKLSYSHRIVCDDAFCTWLLQQPVAMRNQLLRKMMFIKSSSQHHPKEHIVFLNDEYADDDFQNTLAASLDDAKNFCGAIKITETPPFLRLEQSTISKYVRYAVYLSNQKPYRTIILTTNARKREYLGNQHFTSLKGSVIIHDQEDAVTLISSFFKDFETARNQHREFR